MLIVTVSVGSARRRFAFCRAVGFVVVGLALFVG